MSHKRYIPWFDKMQNVWVLARLEPDGYVKLKPFKFESREECERCCEIINAHNAKRAEVQARLSS